MRPFFKLGRFGDEKMDGSFYDLKIQNRLAAIENDMIIFRQSGQKKTSALRAAAKVMESLLGFL